uniref:Uncharacterized protein n=1 Tax=Octopus bimaculoides TaxID=37653 RepID=A0A0L8GJM8_OCTBM
MGSFRYFFVLLLPFEENINDFPVLFVLNCEGNLLTFFCSLKFKGMLFLLNCEGNLLTFFCSLKFMGSFRYFFVLLLPFEENINDFPVLFVLNCEGNLLTFFCSLKFKGSFRYFSMLLLPFEGNINDFPVLFLLNCEGNLLASHLLFCSPNFEGNFRGFFLSFLLNDLVLFFLIFKVRNVIVLFRLDFERKSILFSSAHVRFNGSAKCVTFSPLNLRFISIYLSRLCASLLKYFT